ncbi:MAG TPA: type III-B CRISPR module RAMP protein Cmr4 [Euryarchaeota archaeon]|nr:type III-B CRISPR module RAMP protein Cmr4 [Euryarchaeota archaeon]
MLGPYSSAQLLSIATLTPLHTGVGRTGTVVDLPIQRDPLGFPIIYASSLKGAIKSHVYLSDLSGRKFKELFGPEPGDDEKYSSPISFTDARLVFMPIRSGKASPVMVTSKRMLDYAIEILELIEFLRKSNGEEANLDELKDLKETLRKLRSMEPSSGKATSISKDPIVRLNDRDEVIIGGERFTVDSKELDGINSDLLSRLNVDSFSDAMERIIVLNDDDVLRILEKGMIRLTRIRVDRERKVVRRGALWTEELIPQGSLFLAGILMSEERRKALESNESSGESIDLRCELANSLGIKENKGYLFLGGKETVGRGIVKISLLG